MLNEEEKIDQMRRYWLGFLAEQERCAFEASWFDNDDDSELVAAVRDDLIQDYLAGELDGDELKGFRVNLLGQLNLVEEVGLSGAIDRALNSSETNRTETNTNKQVADIGWFAQLSTGVRQFVSGGIPAATFGALIIVILIGGTVFWKSVTNRPSDTALVHPPDNSQIVPVATVDASNQTEPPQSALSVLTNRAPNAYVPPRSKQQTTRPTVFATLLLGSPVRSQGAIPETLIPQNVDNLRVTFPKPNLSKDYKKYSAHIVAADDGRLIGRSSLHDLSKKKTGQDIIVTFPKHGLVPGKYKFVLNGESANAEPELIWEREFRILKP